MEAATSAARPQPAVCPFCGARLPRPQPLAKPSYEGSEGGFCVCGAAFALDATSHNLGRALLDAYCFVTGSLDLALEMNPEQDLDESILRGYDPVAHTCAPPRSPHYQGAGCLYFVRLRPEAARRLGLAGQ